MYVPISGICFSHLGRVAQSSGSSHVPGGARGEDTTVVSYRGVVRWGASRTCSIIKPVLPAWLRLQAGMLKTRTSRN